MTIKNTTDTSIPLAVDHTNRDYNSIREALIARIKTSIPEWQGTDPTDFGVVLAEAFAYMGDTLNYYIDRLANENFIYTANQRQSLLNIARIYGYSPAGYQSATTTLTIQNNSATTAKTLYAGSVFTGEINTNGTFSQIYFTSNEDITLLTTVDSPNNVGTIEVIHGKPNVIDYPADPLNPNDVAGKVVGYSDGTSNQTFLVSTFRVAESSLKVYVQNGVNYELWSKVDHLVDSNKNSAVYEAYFDEYDQLYILFGDGLSGSIPSIHSSIKVQYLVGGGIEGNVNPGIVDSIYYAVDSTGASYNLALLNQDLQITNDQGIGGSDPESNASIRNNAVNALSPFYRAITLKDYEKLAMNSPLVGKAKAHAEIWNAVNLYVAPLPNGSSYDPYPGYDAATYDYLSPVTNATWNSLSTDVYNFISPYTQIGVNLTILPPVYMPVKIAVEYTKYPNYLTTTVESNIKSLLRKLFLAQGIDFNLAIDPGLVESILRNAQGVNNIYITKFDTGTGTSKRLIQAKVNEILTLADSDITLSQRSSDASLLSLTSSSGAIALSHYIYKYYLSVSSGTSTITLTPTTTDSNASISIGTPSSGTLSVISGGTTSSIALASGVNHITITTLASDAINSQVYDLYITRG